MSRSNLSGLNFSEIQRRKLRVASSKKNPQKAIVALTAVVLLKGPGPQFFQQNCHSTFVWRQLIPNLVHSSSHS